MSPARTDAPADAVEAVEAVMAERQRAQQQEDVVLVRPHVAIVQVRQRPITHDGDPLPDLPEGRPTYVLAEEDGRWVLVAGQNTQVPS